MDVFLVQLFNHYSCIPANVYASKLTHSITHRSAQANTFTYVAVNICLPSVNDDHIFLLQLRVVAYDSSNPSQKATALVTISVSRNEYGPSFSESTYAVVGPESVQLGTIVATVQATDKDGVSTHIMSSSYD